MSKTLKTSKTKGMLVSIFLIVASSLVISLLSLVLAPSSHGTEMFYHYFTNILVFIMNTMPIIILMFMLYFLLGRIWISCLLTGGLTLGLSLVNYYKLSLRDDPFLFEDFQLMAEAKDIVKSYEITINFKVVVILCIFIGCVILCFFNKRKPHKVTRVIGVGVSALLLVGTYMLSTSDDVYSKTQSIVLMDGGDPVEQFSSRGFIYPFLYSVKSVNMQKPNGYNAKETKDNLEQYVYEDIPDDKKVNVIGIMLEAFNDFNKFDGVEFDYNPYEKWEKLKDESYSGEIVTKIFGGGTIVTERNFLSGYYLLPTFRKNTNTYVTYFKEQGYTTEGVHPYHDWYYNRKNVNRNMGFDNYYFYENYFEPSGIYLNTGKGLMWTIPDDILVDSIVDLFNKNKDTGKPYFNFSVSLEDHGAYPDEDLADTKYLKWKPDYNEQDYNICNYYFEKIESTCEAVNKLVDSFREEEEPVVIVLFGDHNPWLGNDYSGYNMLGINLEKDSEEGFYNYYCTPYLFWANESAEKCLGTNLVGKGKTVDASFLMNELFAQLGLAGNEYMQATTEVYNSINVIESPFYMKGDTVTDSLSEDDMNLLNYYEQIQYYWMHN